MPSPYHWSFLSELVFVSFCGDGCIKPSFDLSEKATVESFCLNITLAEKNRFVKNLKLLFGCSKLI